MIEPERAVVTPRVIWPETGDAVPIDEVFHRMEGKPVGAIEIVGCVGSGKTTALRHLAAEAPRDRGIMWLDDAKPEEVTSHKRDRWVVYTSTAHMATITASSFQLAGWGDDDRIEYLLATHSDKCQSVVVRLSAAEDRSDAGDSPLVWRVVLDEMAEDESIHSVDKALWRRLIRVFPQGRIRRHVEEYCFFAQFMPDYAYAERANQWLAKRNTAEELRLLMAPRIQILLAADYVKRWLEGAQRSLFPTEGLLSLFGWEKLPKAAPLVLPYTLMLKIAEQIADLPQAIHRLSRILSEDDPYIQPMAASILHACCTGWSPDRQSRPFLDHAYLQQVEWPEIDLRGMELNAADLSGSGLARSQLDGAHANATKFNRASLQEASLWRIEAKGADFSGAELRRANLREAELVKARFCQARVDKAKLDRAKLHATDLRGASFVGASLTQARFSDADTAGTDFSSANLERADLHGLDLRGAIFHSACLARADLGQCNLEGMRLVGVDFTAAKLSLALLSGSVMHRCKLRRAKLKAAGLAHIQWENADLRNADLRGATFHLGSSRSGLVDSTLASEGTRTGFYTDEFDEQSYQAPEEIRKANLRGADLRGARIDGVDFYLVDLRGAKYDTDQLEHFRRCRAILDHRE